MAFCKSELCLYHDKIPLKNEGAFRSIISFWYRQEGKFSSKFIKTSQEHQTTQFRSYVRTYEGFPVITTLAQKMCEQIVTPPFHFNNLPTQVPKSPHRSQDS